MSQHQMLRRWPLASDWYTDVINYVLRPARTLPCNLSTRSLPNSSSWRRNRWEAWSTS